jgi:hypothetical protein
MTQEKIAVFRIMSPRVMTRENRSKKLFLRVAASREERETRDVAFDYFFRVFVTPKKDKDRIFGIASSASSARDAGYSSGEVPIRALVCSDVSITARLRGGIGVRFRADVRAAS